MIRLTSHEVDALAAILMTTDQVVGPAELRALAGEGFRSLLARSLLSVVDDELRLHKSLEPYLQPILGPESMMDVVLEGDGSRVSRLVRAGSAYLVLSPVADGVFDVLEIERNDVEGALSRWLEDPDVTGISIAVRADDDDPSVLAIERSGKSYRVSPGGHEMASDEVVNWLGAWLIEAGMLPADTAGSASS